MVERLIKREKKSVITKITLTISNAEHIKLLTDIKHLIVISSIYQNFSKRFWICTDGNSI